LAIIDEEVKELLFRPPDPVSFETWIVGLKDWVQELWDPRKTPTRSAVILSILWDSFAMKLSSGLRIAKVTAGIPSSGGVLAFVAGIQKCLVIRYSFAGLTPKLQVVAAIEQPRSAFDVWRAVDEASENARNELKSILASGHKIIYHRGVLVHVDRRHDIGVFGPSIDTLLMAEILSRDLLEQGHDSEVANVLEIGTGSGLLSCTVAQNVKSIGTLFCIDTDSRAVSCTEKNIRTAVTRPGVSRHRVHYLVAPFEPDMLRTKFDLVICNPPYIPLPADTSYLEKKRSEYIAAVGGTELLFLLIKSLPKILSEDGSALVMLSSVCRSQVIEQLPDDIRADFPLGKEGFEASFDVEAVLDDAKWKNFLLSNQGISPVEGGGYVHRLHPVWFRKRAKKRG
jgi:release factor glutamine methyltransferase